MAVFFYTRKPGPTDLTWDDKNPNENKSKKQKRLPVKLFIYGTLKRGKRNYCFLEAIGARFIKEAKTKPEFLLIADRVGIPYLIDGGNATVEGEIYEIEKNYLPALDAFESDYFRKEIKLANREKVWCYLAPFKILDDGIY